MSFKLIYPLYYTRLFNMLCYSLYHFYIHVLKKGFVVDITITIITIIIFGVGMFFQVAWIKSDSKAILGIHTHMVSLNPRLSVTHNGHNTWKLHISHVQLNDSGSYMCQVNTDPMKSQVSLYTISLYHYTLYTIHCCPLNCFSYFSTIYLLFRAKPVHVMLLPVFLNFILLYLYTL